MCTDDDMIFGFLIKVDLFFRQSLLFILKVFFVPDVDNFDGFLIDIENLCFEK